MTTTSLAWGAMLNAEYSVVTSVEYVKCTQCGSDLKRPGDEEHLVTCPHCFRYTDGHLKNLSGAGAELSYTGEVDVYEIMRGFYGDNYDKFNSQTEEGFKPLTPGDKLTLIEMACEIEEASLPGKMLRAVRVLRDIDEYISFVVTESFCNAEHEKDYSMLQYDRSLVSTIKTVSVRNTLETVEIRQLKQSHSHVTELRLIIDGRVCSTFETDFRNHGVCYSRLVEWVTFAMNQYRNKSLLHLITKDVELEY